MCALPRSFSTKVLKMHLDGWGSLAGLAYGLPWFDQLVESTIGPLDMGNAVVMIFLIGACYILLLP